MPLETIHDVLSALRTVFRAAAETDLTRIEEYRAVVALRDLGVVVAGGALYAERNRIENEIKDRITRATDEIGCIRLGAYELEVLGFDVPARPKDIGVRLFGSVPVTLRYEGYDSGIHVWSKAELEALARLKDCSGSVPKLPR